MPSLLQITQEIRSSGVRGPVLLRFPHLIKKQISSLYSYFNKAIEENSYKGSFNAVFPLKVNQFPHAVEAIISQGKEFNYGLEAGSKAELILAMGKVNKGASITVNGFKDKEMITLGFMLALKMEILQKREMIMIKVIFGEAIFIIIIKKIDY